MKPRNVFRLSFAVACATVFHHAAPAAEPAAATPPQPTKQLSCPARCSPSGTGEPCPIERIDVAATGGVPFCIIHGDDDTLVPLGPNSAELKKRYEAVGKGDLANRLIARGHGHSFWEGFFHCQELVDFLIEKARGK